MVIFFSIKITEQGNEHIGNKRCPGRSHISNYWNINNIEPNRNEGPKDRKIHSVSGFISKFEPN